jgi:hypothetical protein
MDYGPDCFFIELEQRPPALGPPTVLTVRQEERRPAEDVSYLRKLSPS